MKIKCPLLKLLIDLPVQGESLLQVLLYVTFNVIEFSQRKHERGGTCVHLPIRSEPRECTEEGSNLLGSKVCVCRDKRVWTGRGEWKGRAGCSISSWIELEKEKVPP